MAAGQTGTLVPSTNGCCPPPILCKVANRMSCAVFLPTYACSCTAKSWNAVGNMQMRCNIPSLLSAIPIPRVSYLCMGSRVRILKLPLMGRTVRIFLYITQFLWHERRKEKPATRSGSKEKNLRLAPHGTWLYPLPWAPLLDHALSKGGAPR